MQNVVAINAAARQSIIAAQATSDEMLLQSIADGNRIISHPIADAFIRGICGGQYVDKNIGPIGNAARNTGQRPIDRPAGWNGLSKSLRVSHRQNDEGQKQAAGKFNRANHFFHCVVQTESRRQCRINSWPNRILAHRMPT